MYAYISSSLAKCYEQSCYIIASIKKSIYIDKFAIERQGQIWI